MPRSGPLGTATPPPGLIPKNPGDIVPSSGWNGGFEDIYDILNTPTPVSYGGTGGATAVSANDGLNTKAADVPSAATTDVWAASGSLVHVTGTNTISSLGSASVAGNERTIVFDASLTLTHSATLILPGAANIITGAGDVAVVRSEGGAVARVVAYQIAVGSPVSSRSPGVAKAWASINQIGVQAIRASYNVSSVTDTGVGRTQLNFATNFSSSNYACVGTCDSATAVIVNERVKNATALEVGCLDTTFTLADTAYLSVVCLGDQ